MFEAVIKSAPVILPVSIATGLLFLTVPNNLSGRVQSSLWWAVGSAICGAVIVAIYLWVSGRWPGMQAGIFLKLGIITFIGFTLLAIITCPLIKMTGRIPLYTLMNLIWAAGYGWFLPQMLK